MWLARDKSGELYVFYETKPYKDEDRGFWFNEGDKVLTPFMGIGSEVYQAILQNRYGIGFELKESYFNEAIKNIRAAESEKSTGILF